MAGQGDDFIVGFGGDDHLLGGSGSDFMDGHVGTADVCRGGNDIDDAINCETTTSVP